ncbi:carbohydrate binding domain-containing protein [Pelagicoccus albus]|uniref:Carbohydrate binding domain-containing protein n=1 Tax=Pelagicoccus albus TaxID=415222 RepID=A0A7X1B4N2_9BACT|nr:carbohydrate binding domain-containing protein [Pelagicoccus albus]MBC2605477.1 carbohydrate binding domain-containing protein [Pelagicoccus albus]
MSGYFPNSLPKSAIYFISLLLLTAFSAKAENLSSRYDYYLPDDTASLILKGSEIESESEWTFQAFHQGVLLTESTIIAADKEIPLDISSLPMGTSKIEYAFSTDSNVITRGRVDIKRLPNKDHAVQIDRLTGGLIVEGLPFIPFGFYCVPIDDLPEREVTNGFNTIGPYQTNFPQDREERRAYMDRCAALGIKVQYGLNSLVGTGHNGSKGVDLTEEEKLALLKEEVIEFRDHPALLSWYINDEPDGQGRPPEVIETAYQAVKELDPYHPVSVVFMMPSKREDFRHSMDIAMTDPYPIPGKPPEAILETLDAYVDAYRHEKSVWLVPQAFGGQEMWLREPTGRELRLMTYLGLLNGARGIQYYIRSSGNNIPQAVSAWSACSDVAVETAQLTRFLLSTEEPPEVSSSDPRVIVKAYSVDGETVIIAANLDEQPKPLSLKLEGELMDMSAQASLWFENRTLSVDENTLNDYIDGYGTRVYFLSLKTEEEQPELVSNFNLTTNPSFESFASAGVPVGSNLRWIDEEQKDIGSSTFLDPREFKEGLFSLRLTAPKDFGGNRVRLIPIALEKGQSYYVSIWAKGKRQPEMPSFLLDIDPMQQSKRYTLSDQWQEYGFYFTAPKSSTSTVLSFGLETAGVAWFDLVQIVPSPVLSYQLQEPGPSGIVSAQKPQEGHSLRYAINKEPSFNDPIFPADLRLEEAATVNASVFDSTQNPIAHSSIYVPASPAFQKPVSLAQAAHPAYPASGPSTLTDGIMGTTQFRDGRWLGYCGEPLDATIDLGGKKPVTEVIASYLCDPNSGIFLPPSVKVYTSADGKNFTLSGSIQNENGNIRGEPYLVKFEIPIESKKQIRYIRVVAEPFGEIPEGYLFTGTISWLFADEILVR